MEFVQAHVDLRTKTFVSGHINSVAKPLRTLVAEDNYTMSSPVALILGAGPNIGAALARELASNDYTVVLCSREQHEQVEDLHPHVFYNLSEPRSVSQAFARVRKLYGEPSVVIYNGNHPIQLYLPIVDLVSESTSSWCGNLRSRREHVQYRARRLSIRPQRQHDKRVCGNPRGVGVLCICITPRECISNLHIHVSRIGTLTASSHDSHLLVEFQKSSTKISLLEVTIPELI